jgi:hypothetical protein
VLNAIWFEIREDGRPPTLQPPGEIP